MGIITTLLRDNQEKKFQDTQRELEGYKSILLMGSTAPQLVKPETMEWAMDNIAALAEGKKSGAKTDGSKPSPFKTLLKGMIGGLGQLNPAPPAPKSVGQRPAQMFRTPEEQQQYTTEQNDQQEKTALANQQKEFEQKQTQDKQAAQQKVQQDAEKRKSELQERLKAIDQGPFSADQKQGMVQEAWSDYTRLGKPAQKPTTAAAKRQQLVQDWIEQGKDPAEAEKLVAAGETSAKPGSVAKDKENNALQAMADKLHIPVDQLTAAQKQEALATGSELHGELQNRAEAQKIIDSPQGYTDSQVKAAKGYLRSLDTKQQNATLTVVNKSNEAAADQSARKLDAEGPTGPEAKKLRAKAAIDPSMDLAAWDWLAYEKFDVRGLGKSTQADVKQIKSRAGQIMDDLNLSPGDIFAIRTGLKGNTAAFSKITTSGAQVSQFEETLKKNSQVARELSDAYKRPDIQLLNRVLNAYNTGTGDDKALNLAAQLHGVAREWAKIMAGSTSAAGVPISEAADADKLIGAALSKGQLDSLFDNVILKDANNRSQAIQGEAKSLLDKVRGSTSGNPSPSTQPRPANEAPRKRPRAVNGKGEAIEYDGKAWVPVAK